VASKRVSDAEFDRVLAEADIALLWAEDLAWEAQELLVITKARLPEGSLLSCGSVESGTIRRE
jgi:hypothetical protein